MQIHPLQLVAWLASAGSAGLLLTDHRDVTYPVMMVAFFISFFVYIQSPNKGIMRGRAPFALNLSIHGLALAGAIALSSWGNLWLVAAAAFIVPSLNLRYVLFDKMQHTSHLWFEVVMLSASIACYLAGNLLEPTSLAGWLWPLPLVLFAIFCYVAVPLRGKKMKAAAQGALPTGSPAPNFSLGDQNGEQVGLSDFRGQPVLLIFVRGDWCPGCHIMLRSYQLHRDRLAEKDVEVLAIGPDPQGVNLAMMKVLGIDYHLLSDEGGRTARSYRVLLEGRQPGVSYEEGMPIPASFLIDREGLIRFVSHPDRVGEVLKPEAILQVLDAL